MFSFTIFPEKLVRRRPKLISLHVSDFWPLLVSNLVAKKKKKIQVTLARMIH